MAHYILSLKGRLALQASFTLGQREDIQANLSVTQPQPIQAGLSVNVTPSKVSQLENDVPYLAPADIEGITEDITELQSDVANKQDTLISGENIKTINDTSILGSGNIELDLSGYATTQDLENGLATKEDAITSENKLDADLLDDTDSTNKLCTQTEKTSWNNAILPFYAVSESLATDVEKVVTIPSITTLRTGQLIIVQPTATSTVAASTIKLNDFDAYPMLYNNAAITTTSDSKVWHANYPSLFVFNGENWVFAGHGYDADTTYTIDYSMDAGAYKSGSGTYAISRYSICMQKPDMTWEKVTATNKSHSTATSKVRNTSGFLLGQIRYYKDTTILANGAFASSDTMYDKNTSLDLRYSTNCGSSPSWSAGDYIYFVGTIGADGLFYLDTTWWTATLPTTNDGKVYIQMGKVLSSLHTMTLYPLHPVYYHDGVQLREYKVADNKQDKLTNSTSTTINNNSVEINETWLEGWVQSKFGISPVI